jgi:hypothetical protein
MTHDRFTEVYSDRWLRDYVRGVSRRLSPTREAAEDAEQECWLAISKAPDSVGMEGLVQTAGLIVASAVNQSETKPSRAVGAWIRVLKENT